MSTADDALFGGRFSWDLPLVDGGVTTELGDGTTVFIRPIRTTDAAALENAFGEMSTRSKYLRFFTVRERLGHELTKKLTDIDHDRHRAWVVSTPDEPSTVGTDEGRGIAVARLVVVEDEPKTAEAALAVIDDYQGRGLGRMLLDLLIHTARATDVEYLRFETLAENKSMRALLAEQGADRNAELSDKEAIVFDLPIGSHPSDADAIVGSLYDILRLIASSEPVDG